MARATEEERQLWRLRIREIEEFGGHMSEWCREHNIPASTVGYWKRMLKKEDALENAPQWLKIDPAQSQSPVSRLQIPPDAAEGTGMIALKYAGITIELPIGCDTRRIASPSKIAYPARNYIKEITKKSPFGDFFKLYFSPPELNSRF